MATIGNDVLMGTSETDIIDGLAGNDTIDGGAGDDSLIGGAGADTYIFGPGSGNDTIGKNSYNYLDTIRIEGNEADEVYATPTLTRVGADLQVQLQYTTMEADVPVVRTDTLTLEGWFDGTAYKITRFMIDGQLFSFNDFVTNETGTIDGTLLNEFIQGSSAEDTIDGKGGNDIIIAGAGNDIITGGAGADTYVFEFGFGQDTIKSEITNSYDTVFIGGGVADYGAWPSFERVGDDLVLTIQYFAANEGEEDPVSTDTLTLEGWYSSSATKITRFMIDGELFIMNNYAGDTAGDDTINGGLLNDYLEGFDGNDIIKGNAGNDMLVGGLGDDSLDGGLGDDMIGGDDGNDTLTGGVGNDELWDRVGSNLLDGGAGNDELILDGDGINDPSNENTLLGGAGDDTLSVWGGSTNTVNGGLGNDQIYGYGGNSTYIGGAGNDIYVVSAGVISNATDDTIGKDTVTLMLDNDNMAVFNDFTYRVENNQLILTRIDSGVDTIIFDNWLSHPVAAVKFADILLTYKDFTTQAVGANWQTFAGTTHDSFNGITGIDIVDGGAGNDTLNGYDGDDLLSGGTGNDTITGGADNDILTGGAGIDTYVFDIGFGNDVITKDNYNSLDTIEIRNTDGVYAVEPDFSRVDNDLVVTVTYFDDTDTLIDTGTITLQGWYDSIAVRVANFVIDGKKYVLNNYVAGEATADTLTGGLTYDYIEGFGGNDTIKGGYGNDMLQGGADDDIIDGEAGNDYIGGDEGNDTLRGGLGNDTLWDDAGTNYFDGGDGNDILTAGGASDTLTGGTGNDTLTGGAGNDILTGGAGIDTYVFDIGFGNDVITKDNYNSLDTIEIRNTDGLYEIEPDFSRVDNDLVITVNYFDDTDALINTGTITLQGWYDSIAVRVSNFVIDGTKYVFNNYVAGEATAETLAGGLTNDYIEGFGGNDTIKGGTGNDMLQGGADDDIIDGEAGNDDIGGDEGNDTLKGGLGNDTLWDDSGTNYFDGGDGNDLLTAGAAIDTLIGGTGNDTLTGGAGDDILTGSAGSDTYVFDFGFGNDVITKDNYNSLDTIEIRNMDGLYTVEQDFNRVDNDLVITVNYFDDTDVLANTGTITLEGWYDSIAVRVANFVIDGKKYVINNYVAGEATADTLTGGLTHDYIEGLGGNDTIKGGYGNDMLQGGADDDVIDGEAGNDYIGGDEGNDTLKGGLGNDTLWDDSDANYFDGGDGNDILIAGTASDTLIGGTGNDTVTGGAGDDILTGGAGIDTYVFNIGFGNDVITKDNYNSVDTIEIRNTDGLYVIEQDFSRVNNDLVVTVTYFDDTDILIDTGTITLEGWYDSTAVRVGNFVIDGEKYVINNYVAGEAAADTITGGLTNDYIEGLGGNDTIKGGYGNDMLQGGADDDIIDGEAGNDYIGGDDGNDTLQGGLGNDVIWDRFGSNYLDGGAGNDDLVIDNDFIEDSSKENTLLGGAGDDTLSVWGDSTNLVDSGIGNDKIYGHGINSTYIGGAGNDNYVISAGLISNMTDDIIGQDKVTLMLDNDQVAGFNDFTYRVENNQLILTRIDSGVDTIIFDNWLNHPVTSVELADGLLTYKDFTTQAVGANWQTYAGTTNDFFYGAVAIDIVDGGAGNDTLKGGAGDDLLIGGAGNDVLIGWSDNDILAGGAGSDTYVFDIGFGNDIIRKDAANNLDTIKISNADGLFDIEPEFSRIGNDLVLTITFFDENDVAVDSGTITLEGWYDGAVYKVTNFMIGEEKYIINNYAAGAETPDTLTGSTLNDFIEGFGDNDTIKGGAGNDMLMGGDGGDYIDGEAGNDFIEGEAGNDTLLGGLGNDTLFGDSGDDRLNGGAGADTYIFETAFGNDTIVKDAYNSLDTLLFMDDPEDADFSQVGDNLVAAFGDGSSITFEGWYSGAAYQVSNITAEDDEGEFTIKLKVGGEATNDTLNGTNSLDIEDLLVGLGGNDTLNGLAGEDELFGGTGNDVLYGSTGEDDLFGDEGDDILYGGDDGDELDGGAGNDTLSGGAGSDLYIFDEGYGNDLIKSDAGNADDIVEFGQFDDEETPTGQSVDDVTIGQTGNDLTITIDATGDVLTIEGWHDPANVDSRIEYFQFLDGVYSIVEGQFKWQFNGEGEIDQIIGTLGNDTLNGSDDSEEIYGRDGNDIIYGLHGFDLICGGSGDDTLSGGFEDDIYLFREEFGNDTILTDNANYMDRIDFSSFASTSAAVSISGDDLLITIGTNTVTIEDWNLGAEYQINTFTFSDGSKSTEGSSWL